MIDGCSHIFDSSNFRLAQPVPEVSRYRRGLPRHATCQFCSVDMLPFHCVDHLLLQSQVREVLVDALRHLRILTKALLKSCFPRLASGGSGFNRVHNIFHSSCSPAAVTAVTRDGQSPKKQ